MSHNVYLHISFITVMCASVLLTRKTARAWQMESENRSRLPVTTASLCVYKRACLISPLSCWRRFSQTTHRKWTDSDSGSIIWSCHLTWKVGEILTSHWDFINNNGYFQTVQVTSITLSLITVTGYANVGKRLCYWIIKFNYLIYGYETLDQLF